MNILAFLAGIPVVAALVLIWALCVAASWDAPPGVVTTPKKETQTEVETP